MRRLTPIYSICFVLMVAPIVFGQTKEPSSGTTVTSRVARRFSEILGGTSLDEKQKVELDDLASAIELALLNVDPKAVSKANEDRSELSEKEEEIHERLSNIENGMSFDMSPYDIEPDIGEDLSPESLELEKTQLLARQLRIKKLELRAQKRQARASAISDAKTMTPLSSALLSTLDRLPMIEETTTVSDSQESDFPGRMARALFQVKDFIGSLRYFRSMKEENLMPKDRYEMARCLEEIGEPEKALPVVTQMISVTNGTDDFWNTRAKSYEVLLKTMLGLIADKPKDAKKGS